MQCILTESKKWWRTRAITATMSRLDWPSWKCELTSRSPIVAQRNWDGKEAEKEAVYGNRRRIQGDRGKRLQRQRGERIERNFAHQFDTGGLDRLYVRGLENVHKKFLIQAAACNLALLMRSMYGSGKPRAAHDRAIEAILTILAVIKAVEDLLHHDPRTPHRVVRVSRRSTLAVRCFPLAGKRPV